ncbi:MAG: polysaccharide biosynthesis/export family protein [Myxococcota bacterium]
MHSRTATAARVLALLALLAALSGCRPSAPTTGYEHLSADIEAELTQVGLGPGDIFEVRVYGEESLSGVHRVSPDGSIDFPLVGRVMVEDLTPDEIAKRLRERLQDGYIRDPFVSVFVEEYHSKKIFILGEVKKPGTFPYSAGMSIVEAITLAGGFNPAANPDYVVVTRKTADGETRIPVPVEKISKGEARNLELQAGDIVFVPDTLL